MSAVDVNIANMVNLMVREGLTQTQVFKLISKGVEEAANDLPKISYGGFIWWIRILNAVFFL